MAERFSITMTDDDSEDQFLVRTVLDDLDYKIDFNTLNNGEELVTHLEHELTNGKNFPSLILLDINMPKMNGLEFLKELRSDPELKHISVYMVTTSSDDSDVAGAYEYNVAGYILKPVDIAHFEGTFKLITDFWRLCEFPKN